MCTHTTIGNHASMMHGANQKQTNCVRADLIETTTKKNYPKTDYVILRIFLLPC